MAKNKTKQLIVDKVIEKIKNDVNNGDSGQLNELLNTLFSYVPAWDLMYWSFGEKDYYKFIEENFNLKK